LSRGSSKLLRVLLLHGRQLGPSLLCFICTHLHLLRQGLGLGSARCFARSDILLSSPACLRQRGLLRKKRRCALVCFLPPLCLRCHSCFGRGGLHREQRCSTLVRSSPLLRLLQLERVDELLLLGACGGHPLCRPILAVLDRSARGGASHFELGFQRSDPVARGAQVGLRARSFGEGARQLLTELARCGVRVYRAGIGRRGLRACGRQLRRLSLCEGLALVELRA
jgi:hypothetical protein